MRISDWSSDVCSSDLFGKPLMNSVFTLGLVVGLSVQDTTLGTTVGNLGWEEVAFPKPVFAGDTLRTETEVIALRERDRKSVVSGKSVSVRVDHGGRGIMKKKRQNNTTIHK